MPEIRDTPEGFVDIDVEITDEQARHLVLAGMFTLEGDVLVITPSGSDWLKMYCDQKIREHEAGE